MTIDLSTHYLGLKLRNPIVVAPCPLTGSMSTLKALEEAGAAAVVLQSMFAEQIEHEEHQLALLSHYAGAVVGEAQDYLPQMQHYNAGPEAHVEFLSDVKRELSIPVIASLNGGSPGSWLRYARLLESAGADALELNIYFVPTQVDVSAADVERRYLTIVESLAGQLTIPFAVKIGPYFTALPHFATALVRAGASGLVLFNRYLDPELNLESLTVEPHLELSRVQENRLVVRWLAILRDHVQCSLAATSGIHTVDEVLKSLLAGANVTMLASALLRNGPQRVTEILQSLEQWLNRRKYSSLEQMIGSVSRNHSQDPSAFERANYMKALIGWSR